MTTTRTALLQTDAQLVANPPNHERFGQLASESTVDNTAAALRARGFTVTVLEHGDQALPLLKELVPAGSEIYLSKSMTLVRSLFASLFLGC